MERKAIVLVVFLILLLPITLAQCDKNQIDVNYASVSELDKLYGIGPAKAQAIIDSRPYETLDDLEKAYGIGPSTLESIKSQNLACIQSTEEIKEEDEEKTAETSQKEHPNQEKVNEENSISKTTPKEITTANAVKESEVISLNVPKDIKTTNNNEIRGKKNFPIYGLISFGLLIVVLILSNKNKKYKNEFRE